MRHPNAGKVRRIDGVRHRWCNKGEHWRPEAAFPFRHKTGGQRQSWCRECKAAQAKESYQARKERKVYTTEYRARERATRRAKYRASTMIPRVLYLSILYNEFTKEGLDTSDIAREIKEIEDAERERATAERRNRQRGARALTS